MIDVPVGRKPANTGLVVTVTECDYDFMILMLFIAVFVQFFVILMWYSAMLFLATAGRRPVIGDPAAWPTGARCASFKRPRRAESSASLVFWWDHRPGYAVAEPATIDRKYVILPFA
jgi:hypothetical protein